MQLADLERELALTFEELPEPLRACADRVRGALRPSRPSGAAWLQVLSPLTVRYPALQFAGGPAPLRDAASRACLPHALLILHSFLEDRHLDGDLAPDRDSLLLCRWLWAEAIVRLKTGASRWDRAAAVIPPLVRRYIEAQALDRTRRRDPVEDLERTACGRALLGFIAIAVTAADHGVSERELGALESAFGHLAISLQWVDDLRDWPADQRTGTANLVLSSLEQDWEGMHDPSAIAVLVAAKSLPRFALERSLHHLRSAEALQRELGAEELVSELASRANHVVRELGPREGASQSERD